MVTAIAVFATERLRRCASRIVAHPSSAPDPKLEICTYRNGKSPACHCARQSAISAGKIYPSIGANPRRLFDSP